MKFRIVEYIHCVNELKNENGRSKIEYVIERKTLFGWKEIFNKELDSKRISHKTYEDAETYMVLNYMKEHGYCKRSNGRAVYEYVKYSYFF
jgi:hypothetical protein